jgi:hypothetical protein
MKVVANRQLHGSYGTVVPDQAFECPDDTAQELLKAGLVRHCKPPKVQYETKIIMPEAPEVSPRETFRDVPVSDPKPATVDSEGHKVLSNADAFEGRTAYNRGRGGRSGSGSK